MKNISLNSVFETPSHIELDLSGNNDIPVFAEEVRQYEYCQRIVYWRRVANIHGSPTYLMKMGSRYHTQRSRYKYTRKGDIVTHRNRYFFDTDNNFGAIVDICREQRTTVSIVEFKRFYHGHVFQSHILQSIVGGLAAEFELNKPFATVEIQYYPGKSSILPVSDYVKLKTKKVISEIRQMISLQILPDGTSNLNKCRVCEYNKICHKI